MSWSRGTRCYAADVAQTEASCGVSSRERWASKGQSQPAPRSGSGAGACATRGHDGSVLPHIEVESQRYAHDIVIEAGAVKKRHKKPSKANRGEFGHPPLSTDETIPWGGSRLIIRTGQSGGLPTMPAVWEEADRRGVEIVAFPTEEALRLICDLDAKIFAPSSV